MAGRGTPPPVFWQRVRICLIRTMAMKALPASSPMWCMVQMFGVVYRRSGLRFTPKTRPALRILATSSGRNLRPRSGAGAGIPLCKSSGQSVTGSLPFAVHTPLSYRRKTWRRWDGGGLYRWRGEVSQRSGRLLSKATETTSDRPRNEIRDRLLLPSGFFGRPTAHGDRELNTSERSGK